MKIAITVSSITPGSGLSKYVCTLTKILSSNNNQIYVITTHSSNPSYENEILQSCGCVTYYSLGDYCKVAKYLNIIRLFRDISPDIIVNNYNAVVQYILPFINKKTKVIHILHNNTTDFYRIGAINGWRVNGWIAPTQAIAEYFNDYTTQRYSSKVVVIPHGVESVDSISIEINETIELVFVGVLYEHKGVKLLPKIIKELNIAGINFKFTIIGQGELRQYLERELIDEILKGQVEMTGVISSKEVYDRLNSSDIFVYPTHLDAFGLVIAEAMMNATVPIVTNLTGITDNLIDDGENGFLVEQDNVRGFVYYIEELVNNRTMLSLLKTHAYNKAKNYFSFVRMRDNYINYINKIISL